MAGRGKSRDKTAGSKAKRAGIVTGVAALGIGAGLAAQRVIVGRQRLRPDPYASEPYGKLRGDRSYEVVASDGAVLAAQEVGDEGCSKGAVFLHGYCLDHSIWHHQMMALPTGVRGVFYDARHHGRSRGGGEDASLIRLAEDLHAVIERSGLEEVVLVGHSMGGMTVLEYVESFRSELGDRIKGLVLVNTTYTDALKTVFAAEIIGPIDRRLRRIVEGLLDNPRSQRAFRLRGDDFSYLLVKLFGFGKGASPRQVEHTRRLLAESFPSAPAIKILKGLRELDMGDALEKIDLPALVIAGEEDRITTIAASRRMVDEMPSARLEVMASTGHMAMMERADLFNREVFGFFREVLGARESRASR